MNRLKINVVFQALALLFCFYFFLFSVATVVSAKIVFRMDGDLYVMNDNGSGKRRLTDAPTTDDAHPRWSPDGQYIAFRRGMAKRSAVFFEVFIINADGDPSPQRLTHNNIFEDYPAWSPDGQHIAFERSDEVHVIDIATRAVKQLTFAETHEHDGSIVPDWSPDGSQITFERFLSFRDPKGGGFVGKRIYVMDADGQHQRPLQPLRKIDENIMQFEPRFSADGQRVLFNDCKWIDDNVKCRLSFANLGGVAHVIEDLYNRFGDNFLISYASWMQNDRAILFAMKRLDKPDPNYDIYRYTFDTRKIRRLTDDPRDEKNPDWTEGALSVSPHGKMTTRWAEIKTDGIDRERR